MEFNPYSIPPILSLAIIFTIGLIAYRYNPSSKINKAFLYLCLSLSFWLINFSIMYNCKYPASALFWARIGFIGIIFIAPTAYYFVFRLLLITPVPYFRIILILTILSMAPPLSDLFLKTHLVYAGIKKEFWGYYPTAGKIYFIYMIFFEILSLCYVLAVLIHMVKLKQNKEIHKYPEFKYVFFACIIGSSGVVDFIAKYPIKIYPFGWLSSLLFFVLLSYAILKHQFLENQNLRLEIAETDKFRAVAALASSIVHEIRNPLTAINTFTEFLPQKKNDPVFLEQFSKTVPTEINRINALMQELLTFAKPSPPQMQNLNPNEIISSLVLMLEQKFISSGIKIDMQFNTATSVQADSNQLKQILLNLILNAIDAMPNGGILTIATSVTIGKTSPSQYYIEISDTGCGIDPEDLARIFEPFFTKKEKGTGLGLAITQGIIEKHGGKINVGSEINKGTTFTIALPLI